MGNRVENFKPSLTGTFPTVMRPKPERRLTLDSLFQSTEVHLGDFKLLAFIWFVSKELELSLIIASFQTLYIEIVDRMIHLSYNALSTSQYRGVVMQKVGKVVDVSPVWNLIGYVANHNGLAFLAHLYYLADRFFHRNTFGS